MKGLCVVLMLVFTGFEASPVSERFIPAVPVFRQPYGVAGDTRIRSGKEAAVGQFPYQAAVSINGRGFCGGSLISKNWVLTAARCVDGYKTWVVTLGANKIEHSTEAGRIVVPAVSAVRHENYNKTTLSNNVGLIQLSKDVAFTANIKTIALPPKSFQNENFVGKTVRVSGWGRVGYSPGLNPTLLYVDMTVITNDECAREYGSMITKTTLCTSGKDGKSTCNGDGGGSLTITSGNTLYNIGIASFGGADEGCAVGYPSGFTATAHFVEWISQKTGIPV